MSKHTELNWYTLAFSADAIANVIPEDYEYKNGKVWDGGDLSQAIEWMRNHNEHDRTLFHVSVSVNAVHVEGLVNPPQPGPVKPWHEYHGNDKVHMPKDPVLSRQETHMNETRRDALVEKVTDILDARSQLTATELSHRDICQDANEIVEAVTRHRDAEIRKLLLSDKAKNASAHEMQELSAQGVIRNHTLAFYGMKAALAAIGLTEEGEE